MRLDFTVPGQPMPRPRARAKYGQRGYYPKRRGMSYPEYRVTIQAAAREALGPAIQPDDSHFWILVIGAFIPGHARGDWDSYGSAASDALEGVLYEDDSQVTAGTVLKFYNATDPRLEVAAKEMEVIPWLKNRRPKSHTR